ncbi:uncharacterized protein [Misgurnus anguillicaudatus]|uniref:uncharacterized protein isoform X2 n=1 Tax=Misgurnus anguillicaudatus TaxID=75329 RepID=UPI003CCF455F
MRGVSCYTTIDCYTITPNSRRLHNNTDYYTNECYTITLETRAGNDAHEHRVHGEKFVQAVGFEVLDLVTCNFGLKALIAQCLSDRYTMLTSAPFSSLLLAAVCLSSRAVPLRSTVLLSEVHKSTENTQERHEEPTPRSPQEKEDRRLPEAADMITVKASDSPEPESTRGVHLSSLVSDSTHKSLIPSPSTSPDLFISSELPQSSAPEAQRGLTLVYSSSVHEGLGSVTAVRNGDGALRFDDRAVWTYAPYQTQSGQQSTPVSDRSSPDQFLVTVNVSTVLLRTSATVDPERADLFNTEDVESSETRKSDHNQPGHNTASTALSRTALQKENIRLEAIAGTSSASTTVTSGSSGHLLTDVELSSVSGLSQNDQILDSKFVDVADVWTEPLHLQREPAEEEEVSVEPSSQDLLAETIMSSEDLPLIFEPFEDLTPPETSVAMMPAAVTVEDAELLVSMDTAQTSSDLLLSGMPERSSLRQTSGTEMSDAVSASQTVPDVESDGKRRNDDITQMMMMPVTVSEVIQLPTSKPKADAEDLESKEEPDEDEEDEGVDSDEEESEEDLAETTMAPSNSLIPPPPPVWMQGNQGLVRSWVELIREKAGYVSGMLAPVGIGIAGALLLVGALYGIRAIHRRRRENIKHQRIKPPREVRRRPDNAMLLADSSEDEF